MARRIASESAEEREVRLAKQRAYSKAHYDRDPEHTRRVSEARNRRFRERHPERAREYCAKARARNGDQWNANRRKRYAEDPQRKAAVKLSIRQNYEKNADRIKEAGRRHYLANKARKSEKARVYRERNREALSVKNRESRTIKKAEINARISEWRRRNPGYVKERYRRDPEFRLACVVRARFALALKRCAVEKSIASLDLVGCSLPELKEHIEQQFAPGMTWANHGEWHVDHIRPCNSFDLSDPAQQAECFHFTNLRPLWAADNLARERGRRRPKRARSAVE